MNDFFINRILRPAALFACWCVSKLLKTYIFFKEHDGLSTAIAAVIFMALCWLIWVIL